MSVKIVYKVKVNPCDWLYVWQIYADGVFTYCKWLWTYSILQSGILYI